MGGGGGGARVLVYCVVKEVLHLRNRKSQIQNGISNKSLLFVSFNSLLSHPKHMTEDKVKDVVVDALYQVTVYAPPLPPHTHHLPLHIPPH